MVEKKDKNEASLSNSVFLVIEDAKSLARKKRFKAAHEKLENTRKILLTRKGEPDIELLLEDIDKAEKEIEKLENEAASSGSSKETDIAFYTKKYTQALKLLENKQYDECIELCNEMLDSLEKKYAGFEALSPQFKILKQTAENKKEND